MKIMDHYIDATPITFEELEDAINAIKDQEQPESLSNFSKGQSKDFYLGMIRAYQLLMMLEKDCKRREDRQFHQVDISRATMIVLYDIYKKPHLTGTSDSSQSA